MAADKKHLLRSSVFVSALTLVSRILGLLRDIFIARFLFGIVSDAFLLAFTIPNLFRRLFGEGALSAAFIPVFVDTLEQGDREKSNAIASTVLKTLAAFLGAVSLVGIIVCVALPYIFDFSDTPKVSYALELLAWMLPYAVFVCCAAIIGAILNAYRNFVVPASMSIVLNLCMIAALLHIGGVAPGEGASGVKLLVFAVLAGGLLQVALQLPLAYRKGFRFTPRATAPETKEIWKHMLPVVFGLAVFQINVVIDRVLAMGLIEEGGAVSVIYLGNRLIQFPLGIFAIAIASVSFPALAAFAAKNDTKGMAGTLDQALRTSFFFALPSAVGLAIFAEPITRLLFEQGRFDFTAVERTAGVVQWYAAGLFAFSANVILIRAFYSQKDMKTPVMTGIVCVIVNFILNLVFLLGFGLKEQGLALATTISSALNFVILLSVLRRRWQGLPLAPLAFSFCKIAVLSGAMGYLAYHILLTLPEDMFRPIDRLQRALAPVLGGVLVYWFLVSLFGVKEYRELKESLFGKKKEKH